MAKYILRIVHLGVFVVASFILAINASVFNVAAPNDNTFDFFVSNMPLVALATACIIFFMTQQIGKKLKKHSRTQKLALFILFLLTIGAGYFFFLNNSVQIKSLIQFDTIVLLITAISLLSSGYVAYSYIQKANNKHNNKSNLTTKHQGQKLKPVNQPNKPSEKFKNDSESKFGNNHPKDSKLEDEFGNNPPPEDSKLEGEFGNNP